MWTKGMFRTLAILFTFVAAIIIFFGVFAIIELWFDFNYPEPDMSYDDVLCSGRYLMAWIVMVGISVCYLFRPSIRKIWGPILGRIKES